MPWRGEIECTARSAHYTCCQMVECSKEELEHSLYKKASHELFHAALELLDIVVAEVQWAVIFDACVCVEQPEFL